MALPHSSKFASTLAERTVFLSINPPPANVQESHLIFKQIQDYVQLQTYRSLRHDLTNPSARNAIAITRTSMMQSQLLSLSPLEIKIQPQDFDLLRPNLGPLSPIVPYTRTRPSPHSPLASQSTTLSSASRSIMNEIDPRPPPPKKFNVRIAKSNFKHGQWNRRQPFHGPYEARRTDYSTYHVRKESPQALLEVVGFRGERKLEALKEEARRLGDRTLLGMCKFWPKPGEGKEGEGVKNVDGGEPKRRESRRVLNADGEIVPLFNEEIDPDSDDDGSDLVVEQSGKRVPKAERNLDAT